MGKKAPGEIIKEFDYQTTGAWRQKRRMRILRLEDGSIRVGEHWSDYGPDEVAFLGEQRIVEAVEASPEGEFERHHSGRRIRASKERWLSDELAIHWASIYDQSEELKTESDAELLIWRAPEFAPVGRFAKAAVMIQESQTFCLVEVEGETAHDGGRLVRIAIRPRD